MKAATLWLAVGFSAVALLAVFGIGWASSRREAGKRDAEAVDRWEGEGGSALPEGHDSVAARPHAT